MILLSVWQKRCAHPNVDVAGRSEWGRTREESAPAYSRGRRRSEGELALTYVYRCLTKTRILNSPLLPLSGRRDGCGGLAPSSGGCVGPGPGQKVGAVGGKGEGGAGPECKGQWEAGGEGGGEMVSTGDSGGRADASSPTAGRGGGRGDGGKATCFQLLHGHCKGTWLRRL